MNMQTQNEMANFFNHSRQFVESGVKKHRHSNTRFSGEAGRKESTYAICLDNSEVNALLDSDLICPEVMFN
ncbi:hypothetical protein JCM19233_1945 [Vibrio astriarenae]|nr:hypothetical protein JCM19233_1945 [Vibrio sp. C7]